MNSLPKNAAPATPAKRGPSLCKTNPPPALDGLPGSQAPDHVRDAAEYYLNQGWPVIPIALRSKKPTVSEWGDRTIASCKASFEREFPHGYSGNIGALLGKPADGLTDIDLDYPEAAVFAEILLPPTAVFGRAGKPKSHYVYRTDLESTQTRKDSHGKMVVEARSTGGQTVFPPSVHEGGDAIEWVENGIEAPASVPRDTLLSLVDKIAALSIIARNWPQGGRHEAQLALAGCLVSLGWSHDLVLEMLCAVCRLNGDEDRPKRENTVRSTLAREEAGEPFSQWNALKLALGDEKVFSVAAKLLGSAEGTGRVQIQVTNDRLDLLVEKGIAALAADKEIYQRDGALIRIRRGPANQAESKRRDGSPVIEKIPREALLPELSRVARWYVLDEETKKQRAIVPTPSIVNGVFCHKHFSGVRPLTGILEAPFLRPNGTVCSTPGYDEETGYLYLPNREFPAVPDAPTPAESRRALEELKEVWADFPYATEADGMIPIAALLTLIARPAITGAVPAIIHDANTRGSGKTKQVDAVSLIATGRTFAKQAFPTTETELEKILSSYARKGAALIGFDNISATTPFKGAALEMTITAKDTVAFRILGKTQVPEVTWRALIVGTGNNVRVEGDTGRRTLVCRIESPLQNPEDRRDFKHPQLLAWVGENRPRLVGAALTLLRGWIVAGRPTMGCDVWGSFEEWAGIVPPAIVFAGGADPMACRWEKREGSTQTDPHTAAMLALMGSWEALAIRYEKDSSCGFLAREIVQMLYQTYQHNRDQAFDGVREAIDEVIGAKPNAPPSANALGCLLRQAKGRNLNGRKFVSREDPHTKSSKWFLRPV